MTVAASLGLFDTLVPIASIVSIALIVGYTLLREERLGLFLLIWWAISVLLSLQNDFFQDPERWAAGAHTSSSTTTASIASASMQLNQQQQQLRATETISDGNDAIGMLMLLGVPIVFSTVLLIWFFRSQRLQRFFLHSVPLHAYIALNMYRLDGLSLIRPFSDGRIPKFLGYQMLVLDAVFVGAMSVPLALVVAGHHQRSFDGVRHHGYASSSPYSYSYLGSTLHAKNGRRRNQTNISMGTSTDGGTDASSKGQQTFGVLKYPFAAVWNRARQLLDTLMQMLVDRISAETVTDMLWWWNSLGYYNLVSAYLLLCGNFLRIEGTPGMILDPALSRVGFHPLPLLVLFHAPLAIATHVLLLSTHLPSLLNTRTSRFQHPIQRLLVASRQPATFRRSRAVDTDLVPPV